MTRIPIFVQSTAMLRFKPEKILLLFLIKIAPVLSTIHTGVSHLKNLNGKLGTAHENGLNKCIVESVYKLWTVCKLRQAKKNDFSYFLSLSLSLLLSRSLSHSLFLYLVVALRAKDWQAVRAKPLNMATKCMMGGQNVATLSTPDNTDFYATR